MFEKEAEEYLEELRQKKIPFDIYEVNNQLKLAFIAGLKKANEWHNVADGDLPKDSNKVVLCICGGGFINGKINYVCRLLTRKEFSLFGTVYCWKEIVLPELEG